MGKRSLAKSTFVTRTYDIQRSYDTITFQPNVAISGSTGNILSLVYTFSKI